MANTQGLRCSEYWKPATELKPEYEEWKFEPLQINELRSVFPKGLRGGEIAEFFGARSSGRTSLCLYILARATTRGEMCAVVDLFDSFNPASAASAGVQLDHIVWVRCRGNAEHAMRASDLLLHAGGFGVVTLDLCEASPRVLNRIPLSYWYRFRRALEHTPTTLLVCADSQQAKSCSQNSLQSKIKFTSWAGKAPFCRLNGLEIQAIPGKVSSPRPYSLFLRVAA